MHILVLSPAVCAHQKFEQSYCRMIRTSGFLLEILSKLGIFKLSGCAAAQATPKGIMVRMAVPQLSIFHVKSHLQKIRLNERPLNEKGARRWAICSFLIVHTVARKYLNLSLWP